MASRLSETAQGNGGGQSNGVGEQPSNKNESEEDTMIPDYNDLFHRRDAQQARAEAKLPRCEYCGEVIYEKFYEINGKVVCEDCLEDLFAHYVEEE